MLSVHRQGDNQMEKISVIGAGSWGTALATVLAGNGHDVTIWSISEEEIQLLQEKREHTEKLPGVILDKNIHLTTNMEEAIKGKNMLVCAVPSVFTRSTAKIMSPFVQDGQLIVNVSKGIEEESLMTLMILCQRILQHLGTLSDILVVYKFG